MDDRQLMFSALRAVVLNILVTPRSRDWSLQGFGMLRTYISPHIRLHVWSERHAAPGVTIMHDHSWDFTSIVMGGEIRDHAYEETKPRDNKGIGYTKFTLKCGEGGGLVNGDGDPRPVFLKSVTQYIVGPGLTYRHDAADIHRTEFKDGTVSLVIRSFKEDTEHAHVFAPSGTPWVSAEPRPASDNEVNVICAKALEVMRGEG